MEFALVLPLLLILLVGIIEFGRAWNEHQVITDAAREAARKGAIHDPSVTLATIKSTAMNAMARAGISVNTRCNAGGCITVTGWDAAPADDPIVVTIELPYRFTFFGPLVKWATGKSNIELKTQFAMRNE